MSYSLVELKKENELWRSNFDSLNIMNIDNKRPWIFFDNAATSLKPRSVINQIVNYYQNMPVNIHRSIHRLSEEATQIYEDSRTDIQNWIGAKSRNEVIFTRGTTESANLVAYSFARKFLQAGDTILVSQSDHHSNIVPWQIALKDKGIKIHAVPLKKNGQIDLDYLKQNDMRELLESAKLFAFPAISNTFGVLNPVAEIVNFCKMHSIYTFVDAAQAAPHQLVDLPEWGDPDFVAFSGHKVFGPTGIGILYGRESLLESMDPFMGGGDMIDQVGFSKTTFNTLPYKFEAGTPSIAEVFGLGAAVKFLTSLSKEKIDLWEAYLSNQMVKVFKELEVFEVLGTLDSKSIPLFTFFSPLFHAHDLAQLMSQYGVAMRSGHLCAQPLLKELNISSVSRASLAFYNNENEIDMFHGALKKSVSLLIQTK